MAENHFCKKPKTVKLMARLQRGVDIASIRENSVFFVHSERLAKSSEKNELAVSGFLRPRKNGGNMSQNKKSER